MTPKLSRQILALLGWGFGIFFSSWFLVVRIQNRLNATRHRQSQLDSLDLLKKQLKEVLPSEHDKCFHPWGSLSQSDIDSTAQEFGIKIEKNLSSSSGANGIDYSLVATASFPQIVGWIGDLELPRHDCIVERWTFSPLDPSGGAIKAAIKLSCRGGWK